MFSAQEIYVAVELPRNVNNTKAMINPGDYIMSVKFSFQVSLLQQDLYDGFNKIHILVFVTSLSVYRLFKLI